MRITILSPYHTGSHLAWAEGYQLHSNHRVTISALSGGYWKWRMHGAAATLARLLATTAAAEPPPELFLATDMLDLAAFLGLSRRQTHSVPVVLYMHENQLTYPLPDDPSTGPMRRQLGERDRHYAFINFTSMLTADLVCFNSAYHRDSLLEELPRFLRHYPDYNELESIEIIRAKSRVLPVGVDLQRLADTRPPRGREPLILWNQRWEFDKAPEQLIAALRSLADEGLAFRLAVCGERFGRAAETIDAMLAPFGDRVIFNGFADQARYRQLLHEADIVVSTARHEFFGISIVEAVSCGAFPILPRRLSYPEIIPPAFHADCLYDDDADMRARLRRAIVHSAELGAKSAELAAAMAQYDWSAGMAQLYDTTLADLAAV